MTWAELAAIASIITALAAAVGIAVTMIKLGRVAGIMEASLSTQNTSLIDLKDEIKELGKVVVDMAVQKTEIVTIKQDVLRLDKKVDELAHGEGFVLPLEPALRKIIGT